jgi:hypothetical protein
MAPKNDPNPIDVKRKALAGYKDQLTRAGDALVKQTSFVDKNQPTEVELSVLAKLYEDMNQRLDELRSKVKELAELDETNATAYFNDLDEYVQKVHDATAGYSATVAEATRALSNPSAIQVDTSAYGQADQNSAARPRSVDALKPPTLSRDSTHVIFTAWLSRLNAYFTASKFANVSKTEQHHYVFACLDDYLVNRIKKKVMNTTDVFGATDDTIQGLLQKEIDAKHPIFVRRHDFFKSKQAHGQCFSDWTNDLRAKGDECKLAELDPDAIYALRYVVGCQDEDLLQKLLETNGQLAAMDKAVAEYEVRKTTTEARNDTSISVVRTKFTSDRSKKCQTCGKHSCNKTPCPAKEGTCNWCLKRGHWAPVCRSKLAGKPRTCKQEKSSKAHTTASNDRDSTSTASSKTGSIKVVTCNEVNGPTPRLSLQINGHLISALPDTGATQTVIPATLSKSLDLKLDKNRKVKVTTANGQQMACLGSTFIEISTSNPNASTMTHALVCKDATDVYISWKDLIALKRLPKNFPNAIVNAYQTDTSTFDLDAILDDFPDVFDDSNIKPMAGKPMTIQLKSDAKPKKVLTARQIPHHLQDEAKKLLDIAISSGVITPVDQPTQWISPAFFVPKPDGRARLVTDYTALNRYVDRPVHPFPSPQDVIKAIDSSSTCFAKLDATSGYFQIALDEQSSLLTTFLLPTGKYRYTRAPMGLSSSSDEFCKRTDDAIRGIPGVIKVVDDILIQASSYKQLEERLRLVLQRCRMRNITLSRTKVKLAQA